MSQRVTEAIKTCKTNATGRESYREHVHDMIKYYDTHIIGNKKHIETLRGYKQSDYEYVNGLLMKKLKIPLYDHSTMLNLFQLPNAKGKMTLVKSVDDAVDTFIDKHVLKKCKQTLKSIKVLDQIIGNAPKLTANGQVVYRGMNYDIYDDLVCEGGKFYFITPTYMSTSFTPSVSEQFLDTRKCATFYTIELPMKSQGVYIHWSLQHRRPFEDGDIDSEYEYILQRGSKFEVISVEFKPIESKVKQTYSDIACVDKHPFYAKHYTLRLVSQPSLEDLKKTYRSLASMVQVDAMFEPFTDIYVSINKRQ
jgi:hypothetical protein